MPKHKTTAIAGFSTEAVLGAIGNNLDNLVDVIAKGQIKGIVALANCSTLRNGPQDWNTVNITKELIKGDILVVAGGCEIMLWRLQDSVILMRLISQEKDSREFAEH